jgi:hypothetical protein
VHGQTAVFDGKGFIDSVIVYLEEREEKINLQHEPEFFCFILNGSYRQDILLLSWRIC